MNDIRVLGWASGWGCWVEAEVQLWQGLGFAVGVDEEADVEVG